LGTLDELSQAGEFTPAAATEILLVFRVQTHRFGIRVGAVEKVVPILEISDLPGAPGVIAGVFSFHGAVVPVLDLQLRMGGRTSAPSLDAQLLIVQTPSRQLAILADEVLDIFAVPAHRIVASETLVAGAGVVMDVAAAPDGLIFIQDADALLMNAEEIRLASALPQASA
jgi:chemotaxis signal transduction protein